MKKDLTVYPYFGKKNTVAEAIWQRFGKTGGEYFEPFFGSGAVCLHGAERGYFKTATVNDLHAFIPNFWRAVRSDPQAVAEVADFPVSHLDINARRTAMLRIADAEWFQRLRDDETFYDVKVAGYWVYVLSNWIGSGADNANPVSEKRPHLKSNIGINATRPHLMDGQGINTVSEQFNSLDEDVPLISAKPHIYRWFRFLAEVLSHTRVLCCDWTRMQHYMEVPERKSGITSIFFDPPYSDKGRKSIYSQDSYSVANAVREWCLQEYNGVPHGEYLRICLAGYEGEHNELEQHGWNKLAWKTGCGYAYGNKNNQNRFKERLWFSPACLNGEDQTLLL
jgi:DNA adenine methylase